jgi:hypothetical protein
MAQIQHQASSRAGCNALTRPHAGAVESAPASQLAPVPSVAPVVVPVAAFGLRQSKLPAAIPPQDA